MEMLGFYIFTKRTDVAPQDLVKFWSRKVRVETFSIALKFDRLIKSYAAQLPGKIQSGTLIITSNFAGSILHLIPW